MNMRLREKMQSPVRGTPRIISRSDWEYIYKAIKGYENKGKKGVERKQYPAKRRMKCEMAGERRRQVVGGVEGSPRVTVVRL